MKIDLNATLREFNTFGFDVSAEYLVFLDQVADIPELLEKAKQQSLPWRVIGGGSNLVLASDLAGYTGLMRLKGRSLHTQTSTYWIVEAMAGENWHEFVAWTIAQGMGGLENLALIPGTVGAAPIQNIGAYGLELAQVMDSLEAFDTQKNVFVRLNVSECNFAYRHSIFKEEPQRWIVTSVRFKLAKNWQPNLSYAELAKAFAEKETSSISPQEIFDKVCEIRSNKLPDPRVLGNSGSFFHNPVVSDSEYQTLKAKFPDLVAYPSQDRWKLAAGWLIDQCGFKGYKKGHVGVYEKQALVLVHHGGGTGQELLSLAQEIQEKVLHTFGVQLSIEPVILRS